MTATREWANRLAAADVVVDGTVLLPQVPVPYLLFLEKQLTDLHTFVRKLPVLDASEAWTLDPSTDSWKTDPVRAIRSRSSLSIRRRTPDRPSVGEHRRMGVQVPPAPLPWL